MNGRIEITPVTLKTLEIQEENLNKARRDYFNFMYTNRQKNMFGAECRVAELRSIQKNLIPNARKLLKLLNKVYDEYTYSLELYKRLLEQNERKIRNES